MRWGAFLLGVALLAAPFAHAEALGPDGFPAAWTAEDFAVVSSSEVKKGGVVSLPVSALPRVAADPSTTPVMTSATVQVSLTRPDAVLPVVKVDEVGKVPTELAKLDMWGPLTEMNGGVRERQWDGVSASQVVALVDGLAASKVSGVVLAESVARSLLTRGKAEGAVVPAGALLAARAEALQGMGMDEAAFALWRAVPAEARTHDSQLARGWASGSLMAGEPTEACATGRRLAAEQPQGFWREVAAACSVLDRMSGSVELALNLVNEQGGGFDPVLRKLLIALRDDDAPVKLAKGEMFSPVSAAVVAQYPALLEAREVARLPEIVLRRLMQTAALPLAMRLEAAEVLLVRAPSPLAAEAVRVLYEAFPFPPDQLQQAPVVAKSLKGAEARALLWQAVRVAPQAADKAAAWSLLVARAEQDGRGVMGGYLAPKAGLTADAASVAALGEGWMTMVRGAWQQGDSPQALAWRVAAQDVSSPTAVLIGQRAQLGLEAAVADGRLADTAFEQWLVARSMGSAAERTAAVRSVAVLEGLGIALPDDAWSRLEGMLALRDDSFGGDMVRVEALRRLADDKRMGPVLVRLAGWAQERPLAAWAPLEAKAAVAALRQVGLGREAKRLAWEILVLPGDKVTPAAVPAVKTVEVAPAVRASGVTVQNMPGSEPVGERELLPPPEGVR